MERDQMRGARWKMVAVCGSSTLPDARTGELAESVGLEIARAGLGLICGGLGGVMEAACRGAARGRREGKGGPIVGLLPGDEASMANPYCDLVLPTGMGIARNALVVKGSDGVVLVHGGSGTLSEAAFAWQLGKPVVALQPSGGWAAKLGGQSLDSRRADRIVQASAPAEAVRRILDELAD
jgi:hypothetical protein